MSVVRLFRILKNISNVCIICFYPVVCVIITRVAKPSGRGVGSSSDFPALSSVSSSSKYMSSCDKNSGSQPNKIFHKIFLDFQLARVFGPLYQSKQRERKESRFSSAISNSLLADFSFYFFFDLITCRRNMHLPAAVVILLNRNRNQIQLQHNLLPKRPQCRSSRCNR